MAAVNVFARFVSGQLEVIDEHGRTQSCGEISHVNVQNQRAEVVLTWNARPIGGLTEDRWEVGGSTTLFINLTNQVITPTTTSRSYASQGIRMVFHQKDRPRCDPSKVAGLTPA